MYCQRCGQTVGEDGSVLLASWTQRFIAFVIDGIIIAITVGLLGVSGGSSMFGSWFGLSNILQFLYFMFMDHYYGQSVGKIVMNLRVTKVGGASLSVLDAAIESFGKVFLLPLDILVGFLLYREMNQRLFNYLSDTVVVRETD